VFNDLVLKFLRDEEVPDTVTSHPVPTSWAELRALRG
jgi:hypothetical protein